MKKFLLIILLLIPLMGFCQSEEKQYYIYNIVSFEGDFTKEDFKVYYDDGIEVKRMRNDKDEKGFCAVKTLDDIKAQDYILTPGRYVGIAEQQDDGEPFEDKMKRLTTELSGLFEQSHRLEDEIRKQLGSIGFKI